MQKFKFFWDQYIRYYLMDRDEYFDYMANTWGDVWYSYMEKKS